MLKATGYLINKHAETDQYRSEAHPVIDVIKVCPMIPIRPEWWIHELRHPQRGERARERNVQGPELCRLTETIVDLSSVVLRP